MSALRIMPAISLLSLAVLSACSSEAPSQDTTTVYHCGALKVGTELNGEQLTLTFNGQSLVMQATKSASGARYVNEEKGAEFWNKGNEAQFSTENFSLPLCIAEGSLPQQISARGNEPFWLINRNGDEAVLRTPGEETKLAVTETTAIRDGFSIRFAEDAELTLKDMVCYDTMSGQSYPYKATFKHEGSEHQGCAGDPKRLFAGATWLAQNSPNAQGEPVSLTFHSDSQVSGFAGCNYLTGSYAMTGENFQFGPLAVTKRMCAGEAMAYEDTFLRQLNQVNHVKVFADGTLQLQLKDGSFLNFDKGQLKLWRD